MGLSAPVPWLYTCIWPPKLKIPVEPPWEGGKKVYINGPGHNVLGAKRLVTGHMTKMAATPINGKNLDLQYSNTIINSISCLHLPTFRSLAAIVSEKSTLFTFSHRKT